MIISVFIFQFNDDLLSRMKSHLNGKTRDGSRKHTTTILLSLRAVRYEHRRKKMMVEIKEGRTSFPDYVKVYI